MPKKYTARQRKDPYKVALTKDPCSYCGAECAMLDHIVARSRGGTDEWDNLTASCRTCNSAKVDRTLLGFLGLRNSGIREWKQLLDLQMRCWEGVGGERPAIRTRREKREAQWRPVR